MKNKLFTVLALTLLLFGVSNVYAENVQDFLNKKEYEYYDFYTGKKPTGSQNLFLYISNQYTYRSLVFENMTQKEVTISYYIYFYDGSVLGPRTKTLMRYNARNNDHIYTDIFPGGPEIIGVVPASVVSASFGSYGSSSYAGSSNPFANAIGSTNPNDPADAFYFTRSCGLDPNNYGTIAGFNSSYKGVLPKNLVFPAYVDGKPVERLANFTNKGITSVIIPNGVKYILEDAFRNNPSLVTIEIPSNIEFRNHAFYDCPRLSHVKIGKNITFCPGTNPNEVFSNNFWRAYEAKGKAAGLYVLLSNGEWRYYQ
jgi:hypothetical protein